MNKSHVCFVCNQPIIPERVEFLLENGTNVHDLTCTAHSITKRIKGLYSGEVGTSDIIFCDKIYNDGVREMFINHTDEDQKKVENNEL